MPLEVGARLGAYEVVSALGAGGMGEVYRARDTKLGRAVAIKVLPEVFRTDPDRVARFEREAKLLAALNHANIAALYGLEEAAGRHFLVMELVEGETLAERLASGSGLQAPDHAGSRKPEARGLTLDEALAIAQQIAEALEAAHEKGIIHRDLKPANIKLTPDDKVKVLDFGLAKAMEAGSGVDARAAATHSPTLSLAATQAGVILGTAAYMSPEQAKGLAADHRSDIFSFGAVLHEMLTGRQPFQGETAAEVMASVLVRETDLSALPADINPRLPELLKRCLEKNPRKRWQAIGDVRAELEAIAAAPRRMPAAAAASPAPVAPLWRRALVPILAAAAASALSIVAVRSLTPSSPPPLVTRFTFTLGEGQTFTNPGRQFVAMSPDGSRMAYVANQRLWLRSMSDLEARAIPGTESPQGVTNPVFSPDGQSIAFYSQAEQALKRVAVTGGAAVTLCSTALNPFGMSWDESGILFGQGAAGIMRVSANGGTPEQLVTVKDGEVAHGPHLLPGGEWLLFTITTETGADRWDKAQIVAQSLKSGERRTLLDGGADARYLPTGHLVYALRGVLFAIRFDVSRLELAGGPAPVLEGIARAAGAGVNAASAQVSVSSAGSLMYIPGPAGTSGLSYDLALLDRNGIAQPLKLPPRTYAWPRVSPDGLRVAVGINDSTEANISIYDLSGASAIRRLTFGGRNRSPAWTPDSQRVAFQSDRDGDLGIFWQRADTSGIAERLTKPEQGQVHVPLSWLRDGETLLFSVGEKTTFTLRTLSIRDKKVTPFGAVQSTVLLSATFSPDGRWVAYHSTETENRPTAVFVQPFPATGERYQIAEGVHPWWSPDGKELLYSPGPEPAFRAVSVSTRPSFAVGNPVSIPRTGTGFIGGGAAAGRQYDSMTDGKRLLMVIDPSAAGTGSSTPSITVVLNWLEELKQRVPTK